MKNKNISQGLLLTNLTGTLVNELMERSISNMVKMVADNRLNELEDNNELYESPKAKQYREKLMAFYNLFKSQCQTDEMKKMLLEFDTLSSDYGTFRADDLFIQGFYEGFKFLQKQIEESLQEAI